LATETRGPGYASEFHVRDETSCTHGWVVLLWSRKSANSDENGLGSEEAPENVTGENLWGSTSVTVGSMKARLTRRRRGPASGSSHQEDEGEVKNDRNDGALEQGCYR
jgi:hypothetical protein